MTPFWYEGLELFGNWNKFNLLSPHDNLMVCTINQWGKLKFVHFVKKVKTRVETSSLRNLKIMPRNLKKIVMNASLSVRQTFRDIFAKIFAGHDIFRKISVGFKMKIWIISVKFREKGKCFIDFHDTVMFGWLSQKRKCLHNLCQHAKTNVRPFCQNVERHFRSSFTYVIWQPPLCAY
jgi:hypothetical protein